jgi:RNA polymerase sigma-70 factor (ECF subfamily)
VDACLSGRREAFDVIVERHRRQIYQLCFRFVGNHEDASDLSQDVFVRAYRALRGFKRQSALATWLYRIGVNVCLNRLSAKAPRFEPLGAIDRIDARAEPPDGGLLREETARLCGAIARLPPKQRATLILRTCHELPHEIAGVWGLGRRVAILPRAGESEEAARQLGMTDETPDGNRVRRTPRGTAR